MERLLPEVKTKFSEERLKELRIVYTQHRPNEWHHLVPDLINFEEWTFLCRKWHGNASDTRCKGQVGQLHQKGDKNAPRATTAPNTAQENPDEELQKLADAFGGTIID